MYIFFPLIILCLESLTVHATFSQTFFACKVVDTEKVNKDLLNKEIELLKLLDHPNVIHLREIWKEDVSSSVHLIMYVVVCTRNQRTFTRIQSQGTSSGS